MQKELAIKLAVIGFIALILMIPLQMISGKIEERSAFLEDAKQSVSRSWTASQSVLSALVVIPYEIHQEIAISEKYTKEGRPQIKKTLHHKFIIPEKLTIKANIENSVRHKGIYNVPVYTSSIDINGYISRKNLADELNSIKAEGSKVVIKKAYFSIALSDPRGINSIPTLKWQNKDITFNPGSKLAKNVNGLHAILPKFDIELETEKAHKIDFSYQLELRGMEQLSFIPMGLETKLNVDSTWPHPQFVGSFLPIKSNIDNDGYKADWKVTSFASNITDKVKRCEKGDCDSLFKDDIGIKHIETVDVYLQSERTVKYGMLFIGLSFITFFIFETLMKLPIHPIQYCLVGFANAIFYLLLISLSENITFGLAYLIASLCCSSLLLLYLKPVLKQGKYAYAFSGVLSVLYGALYIIISMEDLALVMGAFLTFSALAIVMFTTRNINWYEVGDEFATKSNNIDTSTKE
jgi:inner membrane protein